MAKIGTGKIVLAVLAFWVLLIFGGSIPMLWNALYGLISPSWALQEGGIGYFLLELGSEGIGAAIAVAAMKAIVDKKCYILRLINIAIGATVIVLITLFIVLMQVYIVKYIITHAITTVILIVLAINDYKEIKENLEIRNLSNHNH
jgi:hypothetical protein